MMSNLSGIKATFPSRSMGVKLLVVSVLALLMTIPALFVQGLVGERTQRAKEVAREVGGMLGGSQTFLGPVLAIPYVIPATPAKASEPGVYLVSPVHADATIVVKTEERHRSLFKVPVYQSDLTLNASFDLTGVPAYAPEGAVLDWNRAEFLVGASEARGALADATMSVSGKSESFTPAATLAALTVETGQGAGIPLTFFGVRAAEAARPSAVFQVSATLKFSGAQRLGILPYGRTTQASIKGDWPNPSFGGGFLPVKRTISSQGFTAEWSVPFIARGVQSEGGTGVITRLGQAGMDVAFLELVDPYQSVTRSLKYALLFIGLVFLAYFIFEVVAGKRMHPAQYVLVGVAQCVFYLLLLSIAERIGFDLAFAVAATATVVLISSYAGWVFESRKWGWQALVAFSFLYGLIYVLMRLEDQALLVGALASFATIAAVMYFTRKIDWYAPTEVPPVGASGSSSQDRPEAS